MSSAPIGACKPGRQALCIKQLDGWYGMFKSLDHELDARTRHLLRALIARYLAEGEPVGSRTLSRSAGLDVSPATIRNILADLEDAGLLTSPHTSAGRVPTARGLRLFVDSLIEWQPLAPDELQRLQLELPQAPFASRDVLGHVSTLLSAMTRFAGVVSVPRHTDFALRHIEFVPLGDSQLLVVLVFSGQQVQNRVIDLPQPLDRQALEHAANYINQHFAGLRVDEIRVRLVQELQAAGSEINQLLSRAAELTAASFAPEADADVVVRGQIQLMDYAELANLGRLRELFEAFQQKSELVQLMDGCAKAPGVRLFIGEGSGLAALDGCSVITASYGTPGRPLGAVGVIGPTRMAYERVIPVVQATASLLSQALNQPTPTL